MADLEGTPEVVVIANSEDEAGVWGDEELGEEVAEEVAEEDEAEVEVEDLSLIAPGSRRRRAGKSKQHLCWYSPK